MKIIGYDGGGVRVGVGIWVALSDYKYSPAGRPSRHLALMIILSCGKDGRRSHK
jgi:hypothetical protein